MKKIEISFRPSRNAKEALSILRWPDSRILRHSQHRLDFGGDVHILLRAWRNLDADQEFRVFVRDQKIVAITPTYHREFSPRIYDWSRELNDVLREYTANILPALHYDPIGLDLWVDYDSLDLKVELIELTPLMPAADPGLFDWSVPESMNGQFRFRAQSSVVEIGLDA